MGGGEMPNPVKDACEANFAAHANDCSGFARAVAAQLGAPLTGLANQIVDTIRSSAQWTQLADGIAAEHSAAAGKLVLGGLRGDEQANPDPARPRRRDRGRNAVAHGKYPFAYWGRLGG